MSAHTTPPINLVRPQWVRETLKSPTGKGVRIGVIDTGWDRSLTYNYVQSGVGLVGPESGSLIRCSRHDHDRIGHATACTYLIHQLAPDAKLCPIRVFGKYLQTSVEALKAGIEWAVEQEISVINLSLGTLRADAVRPLYSVCERARRCGIIIVAAVRQRNAWSYPALFDNVVSVGVGDVSTSFDYHYYPQESIECLAKGENQWVLKNGKQVLASASSYAAPNITGIIALLLERYRGANLEEIRQLLARFAITDWG